MPEGCQKCSGMKTLETRNTPARPLGDKETAELEQGGEGWKEKDGSSSWK